MIRSQQTNIKGAGSQDLRELGEGGVQTHATRQAVVRALASHANLFE